MSTEPYKISPVANAALSVPVIVWLAVFVVKSVALVPVSALMTTPVTVRVGALLSKVNVRVLDAVLPAMSVSVTTKI